MLLYKRWISSPGFGWRETASLTLPPFSPFSLCCSCVSPCYGQLNANSCASMSLTLIILLYLQLPLPTPSKP